MQMRNVWIVPTAALVILIFGTVLAPSQSQSSAEQELRRTIESGHSESTDDLIFWSGATDHPIIGQVARRREEPKIASTRKNEKNGPDKIERLVVSKSGDLAYVYGTTSVEFDDAQTGKHESFAPTYLEVWQKQDNVWKLAAAFYRPNPSSICAP
jgi:ketosteroid isomerase-like protein